MLTTFRRMMMHDRNRQQASSELSRSPRWLLRLIGCLTSTLRSRFPFDTAESPVCCHVSFVQAEYSRTLYPVCSFINSNATSMHICMVRTPFLRRAALFCSSEAEKMRAHVLATTNCRAEAFTAMPRFSLAKQLGGIISSANVALRLHGNDQHTPLKRSSLHLDHSIGQANL